MKITKRKFKAVLCAILSVCVLTFSIYPVFAEEQAAQEASTEQTQATTIDPNDIDALENRRQELQAQSCLLYTSPSPRDLSTSRMPSSA